jgi:plasmid stability protein
MIRGRGVFFDVKYPISIRGFQMKLQIPGARTDALVRVDGDLMQTLRERALMNERSVSGETRYLLRRALVSEAISKRDRDAV